MSENVTEPLKPTLATTPAYGVFFAVLALLLLPVVQRYANWLLPPEQAAEYIDYFKATVATIGFPSLLTMMGSSLRKTFGKVEVQVAEQKAALLPAASLPSLDEVKDAVLTELVLDGLKPKAAAKPKTATKKAGS